MLFSHMNNKIIDTNETFLRTNVRYCQYHYQSSVRTATPRQYRDDEEMSSSEEHKS